MNARRFGLIIVGDEILSGKRQDKHLAKVIELLAARGLALAWARYVGDDRPAITAALRDAFASGDIVFSCGGIGAWGYLGDYLDQQIVAMVPIAGDGKGAFNKAKCELGKTPIWAFHGDADGTVNVSGTVEPVTGLQMCDPKPEVEMVIYPGVGHDSWSMTYNLSAGHDIYAWFLAHWRP